MLSHQDAQIKARAEIERVLGKDVMPTIADRSRLPYVEGVYLEVMRKYVFAPLGKLSIPTCSPPILSMSQGYRIVQQKTMYMMDTLSQRVPLL